MTVRNNVVIRLPKSDTCGIAYDGYVLETFNLLRIILVQRWQVLWIERSKNGICCTVSDETAAKYFIVKYLCLSHIRLI